MKKLWLLILCTGLSLYAADSEKRKSLFDRRKEPFRDTVNENEMVIKQDSRAQIHVAPFYISYFVGDAYGASFRIQDTTHHHALEIAPMISPKRGGYMFSHGNQYGASAAYFYYFFDKPFQIYCGAAGFYFWEPKKFHNRSYEGGILVSESKGTEHEHSIGIVPVLGVQYSGQELPAYCFFDVLLLAPRIGVGITF